MSPLVQALQYKRGHSLDIFAAFGQEGFRSDPEGRLWFDKDGHRFVASHGDWIVRERRGRLVCVSNGEFKQRYEVVS